MANVQSIVICHLRLIAIHSLVKPLFFDPLPPIGGSPPRRGRGRLDRCRWRAHRPDCCPSRSTSRGGFVNRPWKRKEKCGAFVDRAFCPHASTMPVNTALHNSQAHSGTFESLIGVQSLKKGEQLVGVLHVEADAIVPNVEDQLSFNVRGPYFNQSDFSIW